MTLYFRKPKKCYFCKNRIDEISETDAAVLAKFLSSWGKIKGRKETGLCATHQRRVTKMIKRARIMALLPYKVE